MNKTYNIALLVVLGMLSLSACSNAPVVSTTPIQGIPALPAELNGASEMRVLPMFAPKDMVVRSGPNLFLNGAPYHFSGTNNYYLEYSPPAMVDSLLERAAQNKFNVVRTWGFLDIGQSDGTGALEGGGKVNGIYFQSYDGGSLPTINEGATGLQHLDYVIYKAAQQGVRLVIPFTNNWATFGGMDQYVKWRGANYHDDFYTDPVIRAWYIWWIYGLLNHKNAYTGVLYKNDPTILMWELANEPRCKGSGIYPTSPKCTATTLTQWAKQMSGVVKALDHNHLVGMGDEGFYAGAGSDWTDNGGEGVDSMALARLPNIDMMSAHLYPDNWNKTTDWGTTWITRHLQDAKTVGKPFFLGEFGLQDKSARDSVYKTWIQTLEAGGGNDLFWMLSDKREDGNYYSDYDGFTVYCPSSSCTLLSQHAQRQAGQATTPAPIAVADEAILQAGTTVTLNVLNNDQVSVGSSFNLGSLDLDPVAPGQQSNKALAGGTLTAHANGSVTFTSNGSNGIFNAGYTVQDNLGQTSNITTLKLTVQGGTIGGVQTLFSFEDGVQGWAPASWQTGSGNVSQTTSFHTNGLAGLHISAQGGGGWYGLDLPSALNLTGKSHLKIDLKTGGSGTSQNIALKVGDSYTWCQLPNWGYMNANTSATFDVDLTATFDCLSAGQKPLEVGNIRSIYLYFSSGEFDLDNIRAE